jgi:hypothetical protein
MIGAGKQKMSAAGNGTKLPNHQPVMVDGIVIQHVIFLKIYRVIYKIVVNGVIANLNIGGCDNYFLSKWSDGHQTTDKFYFPESSLHSPLIFVCFFRQFRLMQCNASSISPLQFFSHLHFIKS